MTPDKLARVIAAYRVLETASRVPEPNRRVTDPYAVRTAANVLRGR